ncbi:unnamed protein product [Amoebophrya sp. A120]|nr:unnamed protein product [Amoebophrya sp. A120]|eukprot:GSA120T00023822001.1
MYGLHKVNHMYTASGTGKDFVVQDPYFKGGKIGFEKMAQHQGAKGTAMIPEPINRHKYQAFPMGFGSVGVPEYKLNLSLARSKARLELSKKDNDRIKEAGQRALNGATSHLSRSVSADNLRVPFSKTTGLVEQGPCHPRPIVKEAPSIFDSVTKSGMVWEIGDAKKYGFNGYSRTGYGGLWKR